MSYHCGPSTLWVPAPSPYEVTEVGDSSRNIFQDISTPYHAVDPLPTTFWESTVTGDGFFPRHSNAVDLPSAEGDEPNGFGGNNGSTRTKEPTVLQHAPQHENVLLDEMAFRKHAENVWTVQAPFATQKTPLTSLNPPHIPTFSRNASSELWISPTQFINNTPQSSLYQGSLEILQTTSPIVVTANHPHFMGPNVLEERECCSAPDARRQSITGGSHICFQDGDMDVLRQANTDNRLPSNVVNGLNIPIRSPKKKTTHCHDCHSVQRRSTTSSRNTGFDWNHGDKHPLIPDPNPAPQSYSVQDSVHKLVIEGSPTERQQTRCFWPQSLYPSTAPIGSAPTTAKRPLNEDPLQYHIDGFHDRHSTSVVVSPGRLTLQTKCPAPLSSGTQESIKMAATIEVLQPSTTGILHECAAESRQDLRQQNAPTNTVYNSGVFSIKTTSSSTSAPLRIRPGLDDYISALAQSPGDPCSPQNVASSFYQQARSPFHEHQQFFNSCSTPAPLDAVVPPSIQTMGRSEDPIVKRSTTLQHQRECQLPRLRPKTSDPYNSPFTAKGIMSATPVPVSLSPAASAYQADLGNIAPDSVPKRKRPARGPRAKYIKNSVSPVGPFNYSEPGHFHPSIPLEDVFDSSTGLYQEWRSRDVIICTNPPLRTLRDTETSDHSEHRDVTIECDKTYRWRKVNQALALENYIAHLRRLLCIRNLPIPTLVWPESLVDSKDGKNSIKELSSKGREEGSKTWTPDVSANFLHYMQRQVEAGDHELRRAEAKYIQIHSSSF